MLNRIPFEAILWFSGLVVLAFMDTYTAAHFSLCPLKNLGFDFCAGCGLGKSISLLFQGHFIKSIHTHPMGIFAVIILSFRILNLTKQYLQLYGKNY